MTFIIIEPVYANESDGFIKLPNTYCEMFCLVNFNGREQQVLHAIMRKTLGFNKLMDWLANTQLAEMTGIDANSISKIKRQLLKRRIIKQEGRKVGLNPALHEWCDKALNPVSVALLSKLTRVKSDPVLGQTDPHQGADLTEEGGKTAPYNRQAKHTSKTKVKNNKDVEISNLVLPDFLTNTLWQQFVEHRKQMKSPLTEHAQQLAINKLIALHQQGQSIEAVINQSILNGYKGLFEVSAPKQASQGKALSFAEQRNQHNKAIFTEILSEREVSYAE
ncbi:replication protein [Colwellia sp. MEBiC06753]